MAQRRKRSSQAAHASRVGTFDANFVEDLRYWVSAQPRTADRILHLIDAVLREPFVGIGKPEPLKHLPGNPWSRRITEEHRLVYRVLENRVDFLQCRYHY